MLNLLASTLTFLEFVVGMIVALFCCKEIVDHIETKPHLANNKALMYFLIAFFVFLAFTIHLLFRSTELYIINRLNPEQPKDEESKKLGQMADGLTAIFKSKKSEPRNDETMYL